MKQIALYGKGGIGKSTTAANLSAALTEMGLSVLQIGCDPKRDSTRMLMHGSWIPTVLDQVREGREASISPDQVVFRGFKGVRCVEAGGPEPGVGCAGRGIIATFQLLERLDSLKGDVIVYDVLGDVVCGGFAMPMREGYAQEVYLVTLYAANNICRAIARLAGRVRGRCRLAGVIGNGAGQSGEEPLVRAFADRIHSRLVTFIPRDPVVQRAEINRMTVIEFAPDSTQAGVYRSLARSILENRDLVIPTPLSMDDLESLAMEFLPA
jgi:nitrogenase iron protein NifH